MALPVMSFHAREDPESTRMQGAPKHKPQSSHMNVTVGDTKKGEGRIEWSSCRKTFQRLGRARTRSEVRKVGDTAE